MNNEWIGLFNHILQGNRKLTHFTISSMKIENHKPAKGLALFV
jgi:hypothetical protein